MKEKIAKDSDLHNGSTSFPNILVCDYAQRRVFFLISMIYEINKLISCNQWKPFEVFPKLFTNICVFQFQKKVPSTTTKYFQQDTIILFIEKNICVVLIFLFGETYGVCFSTCSHFCKVKKETMTVYFSDIFFLLKADAQIGYNDIVLYIFSLWVVTEWQLVRVGWRGLKGNAGLIEISDFYHWPQGARGFTLWLKTFGSQDPKALFPQ